MPLKIYKPFENFFVTQTWGNPNGAYAAQFNDPNFKRHNGLDARPVYNDGYWPSKYPLYCPVENFKVWGVEFNPKGGGHGIWLISKDKVQMGDKLCHALLGFFHGDKILVSAGHEPALGEMIMVGDNTGFSTGPHTHIGLYRVNWDGKKVVYLDQNDATGSHDPSPYLQKEVAAKIASASTLFTSALRYVKYLSGL